MSEQAKFDQLGKVGSTKNDGEVLVEKALIELDEVRNDIIIQKNDSAPKVSQTETKSPYGIVGAAAATSTSFKSAHLIQGSMVSPSQAPLASQMAITGSNFNQTATSNFYLEGSLLGNLDNMTTE